MKKILNGDVFEKVKKYVVVKGDNFDGGRCINLDVDNYNSTICFNECINQVAICEVDNEENDILAATVLKKLIELSEGATYSEKEESDYQYYIDETQLFTKCCEYNCSECWKNK